MSGTHPKKQHYLAQSYLKGFCHKYNRRRNQKDYRKIWYYDIQRKEYRYQHIMNVAAQNYYFSWTDEESKKDFSIERRLSEFENITSPLIEEIDDLAVSIQLNGERTDNIIINDNQRKVLLEYLRIMMVTSIETDTNVLRFSSINDKAVIRNFNSRQASFGTRIVLGRDKELLQSVIKNLKFQPPPTRKDGHFIL